MLSRANEIEVNRDWLLANLRQGSSSQPQPLATTPGNVQAMDLDPPDHDPQPTPEIEHQTMDLDHPGPNSPRHLDQTKTAQELAAALNVGFANSSLEDVNMGSETDREGIDQTHENSGSEASTEYDSDQGCDTSALTFGTIRAPKPRKASAATRLPTPSTNPIKRPLVSRPPSPRKKPRESRLERRRTSQLASQLEQPPHVTRHSTASRPTQVKRNLVTYIDLTGDLLEVQARVPPRSVAD